MGDIYSYSDYRLFIRDHYERNKAVHPGFSYRFLAEKAGINSAPYFKFVIEGKRNLSKKTILKTCLALKLKDKEAEYFENLVFFNQASALDEKDFYYRRLIASDKTQGLRKLEQSQFEIFRSAAPIAIREMLGLGGFRNSPEWIAERLLPSVEPQEVRESLKLLLDAGLVKKTPGGYKAADEAITTDDEVMSVLVRNYHVRMLDHARHALDSLDPEQRDISSVCFRIRESDFPRLKKQIQLIRKDLRRFAAEGRDGERVVQVSIQLFPLTRKA